MEKSTSIRIDEDLWKKFKVSCVSNGKTVGEILTVLIKDFLKDKRGQ